MQIKTRHQDNIAGIVKDALLTLRNRRGNQMVVSGVVL